MALFHLHLKQISKKNKAGGSKSAASVIAYRERSKINEFDYRKKGGFVRSYTLIPTEFQGSELAETLSTAEGFAAETEKIEKRKDAQLWDEIEVSLQKELTLNENMEILNKLINETYTVKNQAARVFVHHPEGTDNIHAHVLIIQRPLEKAPNGAVQLGKKLRQEFGKGKPKNADKLVLMRSRWSSLVNEAFARKNLDLAITHESLKVQHEKALAKGDLVKAAETDRPPLYLPKTSRNNLTEVIVTGSGDYNFEANKQHLANISKSKDIGIENLTIDFWIKATSFWANAKKIRTNFKLARRKQRETVKKIIRENLLNVQIYADESIKVRLAAVSGTISSFTNYAKSITARNTSINISSSFANVIKSISQFKHPEPNRIDQRISNNRSGLSANGKIIVSDNVGNPTRISDTATAKTTTSGNNIITTASTNTADDLEMILNKEIEARFNKQLNTPRRRI